MNKELHPVIVHDQQDTYALINTVKVPLTGPNYTIYNDKYIYRNVAEKHIHYGPNFVTINPTDLEPFPDKEAIIKLPTHYGHYNFSPLQLRMLLAGMPLHVLNTLVDPNAQQTVRLSIMFDPNEPHDDYQGGLVIINEIPLTTEE